jgi:hypothetical protein
MTEITFKQANRRYVRMFVPMMILYSVFCFAGPALLAMMGSPPRWLMGLVAVITGAPIAGVFWLMGRLLRETDEYTRAIQVDALLSGGAITLSLAVVWSFLELYQVVPRAKFFPSMMMVGPGFFFAYGLSFGLQAIRRRREARE